MKLIKQVLAGIGVIFVLLVTVWQSFTYLDKYALCANVDKQVERIDKQMDMMQQIQKKEIKKLDQKTQQQKILFKFELNALELKQVSEQIEQMERTYGVVPKDQIKRADLEKLKRRREELLIEQGRLKEKN